MISKQQHTLSIFRKLFGWFKKSETNSANKKFNLEELLASDNVNNSIIEIDNYVCKLCAWGDNIEKLTEQQKTFYYNQNLEREINNGGFAQYFFNSSGDFAHETIKSLRIIKADKTAEILEKAIEQFPEELVPRDRNIRQDILEQMTEVENEFFEELDQKFFKYEDDLNALNIEFVKQNKDNFRTL